MKTPCKDAGMWLARHLSDTGEESWGGKGEHTASDSIVFHPPDMALLDSSFLLPLLLLTFLPPILTFPFSTNFPQMCVYTFQSVTLFT